MSKKSFILSSAGLKNLVTNQSYEDNFKFIFGEHEIQMKNLFAEFISPYVSHIHQSDPTINSFQFYNKNTTNKSTINYLSQMSDDIFNLLESISKGESIEIDDKQCLHLQIVSIFLKNKEMFTKLDELFEKDDNDENIENKINEELEFLSFLEMSSELTELWNRSKSIEYIASQLYSIDVAKINDLPRTVFYSILKNDKLTIESEDWLLDLINSFLSKEETCENSNNNLLRDIHFYEEVNYDFLSEDKLIEFIEKVNPNEITVSLWNKIKKCFYVCMRMQRKPDESNKRNGNGFYHNIHKCAERIIIGGLDGDNQLGQNPNNKNKSGTQIVHPNQNLSLDPSSLLSYSPYYRHSVAVTLSGSMCGVGFNGDGRIVSSLPKSVISQFSEFSMNDSSGRPLAPVSAACTQEGTLYMFTKNGGSGRQLVFCDDKINGGTPVFLDIGSHEPVSLFCGIFHAAAICAEGEIIFINRDSVKNSPSSQIAAYSLPGGEKATLVACLYNSILALSSSGRVYTSDFESGSSALKFSAVSELSGKEIIWLSGTNDHCLAVSREGHVFGRGSNSHGQLGVGKETNSVSSFTEISSLSSHKIKAAYAGGAHSLFETHEGKVLACGYNCYGELLLSSLNDMYVYSPTETTITGGATFCVAGACMSAVFIGGDPPPNTPNMRVQLHQH